MTKVLGVEQFRTFNDDGKNFAVLLPPGTEVKRGDILVVSNEGKSLDQLNLCGEELVRKTSV